MDTEIQHRHGHAAWTWKCNMDMNVQYGHAKWTCMIDKQHGDMGLWNGKQHRKAA
jgi:hypothetical protein